MGDRLGPIVKVPSLKIADPSSIFGTVSGIFAQIAQRNNRLADQVVAEQFKQAGGQAALAGTFTPREGASIADQAFNAAGINTSLSRLETEARSTLEDLREQHKLSPQAFEKASLDFIKSTVRQFGAASPEAAALLEKRVSQQQARILTNLESSFFKRTRDSNLAAAIGAEDSNLQELFVASEDLFSEDPVAVTQSVISISDLLADMERIWSTPDPETGRLFSEADIAGRRIELFDRVYEHAVRSFIRHSEDPLEVAEKIIDGSFEMPVFVQDEGGDLTVTPREELPPQIVDRLINFARSENAFRESEDREAVSELRQRALGKLEAMEAELIENNETTVSLESEEIAVLKDREILAFENVKMTQEALVEVNRLPTEEAEALVNDIEVVGPEAAFQLQRKDILRRALELRSARLLQNPAAFTIQNSEMARRAQERAQTGLMTVPGANSILLAEEKRLAGGLLGFEAKLLPPNLAQDMVAQFTDLENLQQRTEFLSAQQEIHGFHYPRVISELVGQGLPPAAGVVAGLDSRKLTTRQLANGLILRDRKALNDSLPSTANKNAIDDDVIARLEQFNDSLPPGNETTEAGMREAGQVLARVLMKEEDLSEAQASKKAVRALVDERWNFENGVRVPKVLNGRELPFTGDLRAGLSDRNFVNKIEEFADQIDTGLDGTETGSSIQGLPQEDVDREYIRRLKFSGRFVTAEDETGVELLDANERPVRLKSTRVDREGKPRPGEKLRFSWQELSDNPFFLREIPLLGGVRGLTPFGRIERGGR